MSAISRLQKVRMVQEHVNGNFEGKHAAVRTESQQFQPTVAKRACVVHLTCVEGFE